MSTERRRLAEALSLVEAHTEILDRCGKRVPTGRAGNQLASLLARHCTLRPAVPVALPPSVGDRDFRPSARKSFSVSFVAFLCAPRRPAAKPFGARRMTRELARALVEAGYLPLREYIRLYASDDDLTGIEQAQRNSEAYPARSPSPHPRQENSRHSRMACPERSGIEARG
jgi:hypothetical protein